MGLRRGDPALGRLGGRTLRTATVNADTLLPSCPGPSRGPATWGTGPASSGVGGSFVWGQIFLFGWFSSQEKGQATLSLEREERAVESDSAAHPGSGRRPYLQGHRTSLRLSASPGSWEIHLDKAAGTADNKPLKCQAAQRPALIAARSACRSPAPAFLLSCRPSCLPSFPLCPGLSACGKGHCAVQHCVLC